VNFREEDRCHAESYSSQFSNLTPLYKSTNSDQSSVVYVLLKEPVMTLASYSPILENPTTTPTLGSLLE
jgi:hypothetical protein